MLILPVVFWIILGALVGWIAAMIDSTSKTSTTFKFIGVGVIGALLGGSILFLTGIQTSIGAGNDLLIVPILSAVAIVFIAAQSKKTLF